MEDETAETIDQMMKRVGADFMRRSKALNAKADALSAAHDVRGARLANEAAARWGNYGNATAKGVFPINGSDPELSLIFGPERHMALKAGRTLGV
jgi:hypothetical protein